MNIAIIDADLIGKKQHRFPNLASMKISGYHKELGDFVTLKTDYDDLKDFDKVYISKVFTDTPVDENVLNLPYVQYGGTGFYYYNAPKLKEEIEHHMPDYHLYDAWISEQIKNGANKNSFKCYTDYSIGFITRGCFRKCEYCVNKNCNTVVLNSHLHEFYDNSRKKICLLDDNILGYPDWKDIFEQLQETGKPFRFKQGMDERLLTPEKCKVIFQSKYDGNFIFAFDNIKDYDLIEKKLNLLREYTDKCIMFYVLCGFDRNSKYDKDFWKNDIFDMFSRIKLLMKYHCIPYIMRFNRYVESPYAGVYKTVAAWCNQPSFFKKKSLREFGIESLKMQKARNKYIVDFEQKFPEFREYMDMKWK